MSFQYDYFTSTALRNPGIRSAAGIVVADVVGIVLWYIHHCRCCEDDAEVEEDEVRYYTSLFAVGEAPATCWHGLQREGDVFETSSLAQLQAADGRTMGEHWRREVAEPVPVSCCVHPGQGGCTLD